MTSNSEIYTLKSRPQFLAVATAGNKKPMPGLVVQISQSKDQTEKSTEKGIGVGLTVSRSCGGAVDRNRIKRRLRRANGVVFPEIGRAGCIYVVIGRRSALNRDYELLISDLKTAIETLHKRLDKRNKV